jgi:hypothetical protein
VDTSYSGVSSIAAIKSPLSRGARRGFLQDVRGGVVIRARAQPYAANGSTPARSQRSRLRPGVGRGWEAGEGSPESSDTQLWLN